MIAFLSPITDVAESQSSRADIDDGCCCCFSYTYTTILDFLPKVVLFHFLFPFFAMFRSLPLNMAFVFVFATDDVMSASLSSTSSFRVLCCWWVRTDRSLTNRLWDVWSFPAITVKAIFSNYLSLSLFLSLSLSLPLFESLRNYYS